MRDRLRVVNPSDAKGKNSMQEVGHEQVALGTYWRDKPVVLVFLRHFG